MQHTNVHSHGIISTAFKFSFVYSTRLSVSDGVENICPWCAMALLGANKRNRISRLKIAVEKLQRSFTLPKETSCRSFRDSNMMMNNGELRYKQHVEVKKGHFSVLAIDGGNAKRYVLPLCYLQNPSFLRLLEKASEEFGFEHEGALCIPCGWNELESILGLDRRY